MAYRRSNLTPRRCVAILWFRCPIALFWVFNATGSLPLALVAWILPGILFGAIGEGALEPPTRVYLGPRGGAYRINANGRKSYDETEEEIRRSREYYDKPAGNSP